MDVQSTIRNRQSSIVLAVREPAIQHEVNQNAGNADVHPQRPRPFGDGAVTGVAGAQAAAQRDDHHGDNYDGERHMRNEHHKINLPPEPLTEKKNVAYMYV